MLVLSRRPDEQIVLPTVPALIKVISAQANLVRLGIEAPSHVPIVREELTRNDRRFGPATTPRLGNRCSEQETYVRNRLNNLHLGLTLLRMQLTDCDPVVGKTLDGLEEELLALCKRFPSNTNAIDSVSKEHPVSAIT